MKRHGIEAWVEQQDKAGRCPECGKRLYWFARVCPACHSPLKR
jgi:predicted amidophosphoribosyltransferase